MKITNKRLLITSTPEFINWRVSMKNRLAYLAAIPFLMLILAQSVIAEEDGKNDFMKYCAACHGIDGKGSGDLSLASARKPADLTVLSQGNNGYFPYVKIRNMIDGRVDKGKVRTHYDNDMPVWGKAFTDTKGKSVAGQIHGEAVAKMRILNIVDYLVSIQEQCVGDCKVIK